MDFKSRKIEPNLKKKKIYNYKPGEFFFIIDIKKGLFKTKATIFAIRNL